VTELPRYCPEVRFYSKIGVSYGYGSKLLDRGVILPDGFMDNDAPLFLSDPENLERHRRAVATYRATIREAKENALATV
jgi:hypothetical protein